MFKFSCLSESEEILNIPKYNLSVYLIIISLSPFIFVNYDKYHNFQIQIDLRSNFIGHHIYINDFHQDANIIGYWGLSFIPSSYYMDSFRQAYRQ